MGLSSEIVVILAAVGAVIFLFLMDYYYRKLESKYAEETLDIDEALDATLNEAIETTPEPDTYVEMNDQSDEPNVAA